LKKPLFFEIKSKKNIPMKKIKTKDINPERLITKSRYAEKMGITPAAVQKQIETGKLTIIKANGAELIHE
jgi:hypothetical protein